jgi:segregation and condensation protein A
MAALLIHIKSRCLLPPDPEMGAREPDPRQELVRQLLDHDQVRHGAEFLQQKLEVAEATWSRSSIEDFRPPVEEESLDSYGALNLLQVLRLAQQALAAARTYDLVTPASSVDVAEMMAWLEERLRANPWLIEAGPLLAQQPDAPHRMALFLAMLEMAKAARIRLEQQQCFGPILLASLGEPTDLAQLCLDVKHTWGTSN